MCVETYVDTGFCEDKRDERATGERRTMTLLGNLIWLIFGGFFAGLGYILGGLVLCGVCGV